MNWKSGPLLAVSLFCSASIAPALVQDDAKSLSAQARGILRQYCHR
jgi:hypothetical protein